MARLDWGAPGGAVNFASSEGRAKAIAGALHRNNVDVAHELGDELGPRRGVDLVWRADLHELTRAPVTPMRSLATIASSRLCVM